MDEILAWIYDRNLVPIFGRVYDIDSLRGAVFAQDEGRVNGTIAVKT